MALTTGRALTHAATQDKIALPMGAARTVYQHGYVGRDPAGYAKAFAPGDDFVGIAYETVDNSAGAAGAKNITIHSAGDWVLPLTSVAQKDVGRPVFATDDETLAFVGHPDGYVGRVVGVDGTNRAIVRMRAPGDLPNEGCILIDVDFSKLTFPAVLTAGGEQYIGAILRIDAIGAGIVAVGVSPSAAEGEVRMLLDNDNEAENLSIETPQVFSITRGITFDFEGRLKTAGGAATDDVDFGLFGGLAAGLTDTERANADATTSGLKSCKFHLDANANDIFASSDDDANPIAAADTGVDNSLTVNKKHRIVGRVGGACETWIDGVRVLASTAFSVSATGLFCGLVNLEKSTGTGVPEVRGRRMRVAGAAA